MARPTFTAIDFETANHAADSACAVGLVRVERGAIVERCFRLIRPPTRKFVFTYVHGLRWRDVATAPSFAEVWREVSGLCEGVDFLAAHNAAFDRGVLESSCARARLAAPAARFECTIALARRRWGVRRAGLAAVASYLGIPLLHHQALSDAEACARIVLRSYEPAVSRSSRGDESPCLSSLHGAGRRTLG
jgi:DNA polymerase-3 subunit epsilon